MARHCRTTLANTSARRRGIYKTIITLVEIHTSPSHRTHEYCSEQPSCIFLPYCTCREPLLNAIRRKKLRSSLHRNYALGDLVAGPSDKTAVVLLYIPSGPIPPVHASTLDFEKTKNKFQLRRTALLFLIFFCASSHFGSILHRAKHAPPVGARCYKRDSGRGASRQIHTPRRVALTHNRGESSRASFGLLYL